MKKCILFLVTLLFSIFTYGADIQYTLKADIRGYIGVGDKIDGVINPDLKVTKGDHVKIIIINVNRMPHNIALKNHNVVSDLARGLNDRVFIEFVARTEDTYICTLPGHEQAGMKGRLIFKKSDINQSEDVVKIPTDIPSPITYSVHKTVTFNIVAKEITGQLDDKSTYNFWTFNGTIPGPMLRARIGDKIVINFTNDSTSKMPHSIDFHAVEAQHGGASSLKAGPGETKQFQFIANKAGLYVYHCATPDVPTHIAKGMFGMILIEPEEGLDKVDHEFYFMQGEYYTKERLGFSGHHTHDGEKLMDENPTYVVINGNKNGITGKKSLKVKAGDKIRVFFGVGGPNLISSFHIIGEIFDKVYSHGSFKTKPAFDVQTVLVPAGGATILELVINEPGQYILVDHSLARLNKGARAIIIAE